MKRLLPLLLLLFTFSLSVQVAAADNDMSDMEVMSDKLKVVNKKLIRGQFEGDDLVKWTKLSIKMKSAASL